MKRKLSSSRVQWSYAAAAAGATAGINLLAMNKTSYFDESMIGSLVNFISNRNQILSNQKNKSNQCLLHLVWS